MKKFIFFLSLVLQLLSLSANEIYYPSSNPNTQLIEHSYYSLSYNETYEQADWVAYELTKEEVLSTTPRKDSFKADKRVLTGSASLYDYKGSGYDRGHLAPAADMKMNSNSMLESFYLSNMSPQNPSFNRGIWKKLEEQVRSWAVDNEAVFVVTGGVLNGGIIEWIGENRVAVPAYYYKVILDYTKPELKGIGFILPNQKCDNDLQGYAVTIDQVEIVTGIDFFPMIEDGLEERLESQIDIEKWSFDGKSYTASSPSHASNEVLDNGKYWINSSSMTRHNSSCRYYGNTKKGYYINDPNEGTACKSCGG